MYFSDRGTERLGWFGLVGYVDVSMALGVVVQRAVQSEELGTWFSKIPLQCSKKKKKTRKKPKQVGRKLTVL